MFVLTSRGGLEVRILTLRITDQHIGSFSHAEAYVRKGSCGLSHKLNPHAPDRNKT